MLIFDIETEENLQCGITSGGGAKGGGGSLATQGSATIVSTKRASGNAVGAVLNAIATVLGVAKTSGAPSRSAGQPRARALDAAFGELAKRGATGRVGQPSLGAQRQVGNRAGNTAPKAVKATRAPKSVAQQNRDRIARGKTKTAKTNKQVRGKSLIESFWQVIKTYNK